jgi:hypothetical protein
MSGSVGYSMDCWNLSLKKEDTDTKKLCSKNLFDSYVCVGCRSETLMVTVNELS